MSHVGASTFLIDQLNDLDHIEPGDHDGSVQSIWVPLRLLGLHEGDTWLANRSFIQMRWKQLLLLLRRVRQLDGAYVLALTHNIAVIANSYLLYGCPNEDVARVRQSDNATFLVLHRFECPLIYLRLKQHVCRLLVENHIALAQADDVLDLLRVGPILHPRKARYLIRFQINFLSLLVWREEVHE